MSLGNGLYFIEKKSGDEHDIFVKEVTAGRKGMLITSANPMEVRSKYGFLSTVVISTKDYIVTVGGKKRIEKSLFSLIEQFIDRYQNMVLMIEDIDEIMNDSFSEIIDIMNIVSQAFLSKNIIFILVLSGNQDENRTKILVKDYGILKM